MNRRNILTAAVGAVAGLMCKPFVKAAPARVIDAGKVTYEAHGWLFKIPSGVKVDMGDGRGAMYHGTRHVTDSERSLLIDMMDRVGVQDPAKALEPQW